MTQDGTIELDESARTFWTLAFVGLLLACSALTVFGCSDALSGFSAARVVVFQLFILGLLCALIAYAGGADDFAGRLLVTAVPVGLAGAMFLAQGWAYSALVSAAFYILVIVCAFLTVDHEPASAARRTAPARPGARQGLMHAWAVSGALLTGSHVGLFWHPPPGLPARVVPIAIQAFLLRHATDLRVMVGIIAAFVLLGTAIARVSRMGRAAIPTIPALRLQGLRLPALLHPVFRPLLRAVVVVWAIVRVPADAGWKALAHAGVTIARIARELGRLLIHDVLRPWKLATIVAQAGFWLTLVAAAHTTEDTARATLAYVPSSSASLLPAGLVHLGTLAGFLTLATGALLFLGEFLWLNESVDWKEALERGVLCVLMFLFAFSGAGLLTWVAARSFGGLLIRGFAAVGPVTLFVLLPFVLVLFGLFLWEGLHKRPVAAP